MFLLYKAKRDNPEKNISIVHNLIQYVVDNYIKRVYIGYNETRTTPKQEREAENMRTTWYEEMKTKLDAIGKKSATSTTPKTYNEECEEKEEREQFYNAFYEREV